MVTIQTKLGHPATLSPNKAALTTINITPAKEKKQHNIPKTDAIDNGVVENAAIPSNEYINNFQKLHFVSPATLSTFLKGIHFVLYPTHPKMPLLKRLYSLIFNILSTICLLITL